MNLRTKITFIFDLISDFCAGLAGFTVAFMIASVCAEIVMRYFLNRPLAWVVQVNETSLLFLTFLGVAWVQKKGFHVKVDILFNYLKPSTVTILNTIASITGAIVCLVLVWYGAQEAWDASVRGLRMIDSPRLPSGPIIAIIPIGSFLWFIQFLRDTYKCLSKWRAPLGREQIS